MIIMALKPGHDGSIAVVKDRKLILSIEAEKDSNSRYSRINPMTVLEVAEQIGDLPDVVALGGWSSDGTLPTHVIGGGYHGTGQPTLRSMRFFGKNVQHFTSSHERSHLMMALGLAPRGPRAEQAVLIWEGETGRFIIVDEEYAVMRCIDVLTEPGGRYASLFAIADPTFPDSGAGPRLNDAGKLMALAAFGDPLCDEAEVQQVVHRIIEHPSFDRVSKGEFQDSPLYNAGVESAFPKNAAAVLSRRIFEMFADAAVKNIPAGLPLSISGGCGLNCEWNAAWRDLGHFSSVFVPPCTNDSGSAVGTAADALLALTGDPHIGWDVYSGLSFDHDVTPDAAAWRRERRDDAEIAKTLASGNVVAWVQGRWEIGPRALGNRSLLATPFHSSSRELLNQIKTRESYRPIAPCCRIEDVGDHFEGDFEDPYMLYFRRVTSTHLPAVTHVDGSARVQTVSKNSNGRLHTLLTEFKALTGAGILCNTSLNFNGFGFINRLSDLIAYCENRGIDEVVVDDVWYRRNRSPRVKCSTSAR